MLVCEEITWVTRSEWGARPPKEPPTPMPHISVLHVFIHHTLSPDQCHSQSAFVAALRSIQNFHMDDRKWNDIGYNFLMGGDLPIYEGRGWYAIGAHTRGMNDRSVALSLIGNYETVSPPKAMLDLAQKWIACTVEKGVVAPDYQLHGHRDQNCTECPGQRLYDIIKGWSHFKGGPLDSFVCKMKSEL